MLMKITHRLLGWSTRARGSFRDFWQRNDTTDGAGWSSRLVLVGSRLGLMTAAAVHGDVAAVIGRASLPRTTSSSDKAS